jgi:response regulator RpfG family c-di-GMP phosphodiesterase
VAAGLRTAVGHPLRLGGQVVGVAEFFSRHQSAENPELLELGSALAGRLSDALGRHRAQEALRDANHALEIRVRERTTDLQRTVADLDVEQCGLIERASPLHDVGKVAIPDSVLLKPGPLTAAERLNIETHAEIGHRLLDGSDSAVLQLAATIALTHHEHYDGGGYPRGLAGESIPIEGRMVAIADVFDALTSDRVYRPAMTIDQALAILRDGRGTHFDPVLLDHFLNDLHDAGAEPHTTALDCITASPTSAGPRASAC